MVTPFSKGGVVNVGLVREKTIAFAIRSVDPLERGEAKRLVPTWYRGRLKASAPGMGEKKSNANYLKNAVRWNKQLSKRLLPVL